MQHNGCDKGDGTAVSLKVMKYRYSYLSLSKEGADKDGGQVKQETYGTGVQKKEREVSFSSFIYVCVLCLNF